MQLRQGITPTSASPWMKSPALTLPLIAAAALLAGAPAVHAQAPAQGDIDVKVMGVTFIEPPPGRDKNLVAFGVLGGMEKVEITAVATTRAGLFTDYTNSFFDKGDVRVTAVFPDKSTQSLGQAEVGGFPKFSADARARSFSLSLNRLPDRTVTGLIFEGTVPLSVAKRTKKAAQAFDPNKPGPVKLGGVEIKQFKVDGKSVQFLGNDTLQRIKTLSFKLPSGQVVRAERGGWGRMNNEFQQTWNFDTALSRGELQADLYEEMETVRQPVRFAIGRPW